MEANLVEGQDQLLFRQRRGQLRDLEWRTGLVTSWRWGWLPVPSAVHHCGQKYNRPILLGDAIPGDLRRSLSDGANDQQKCDA